MSICNRKENLKKIYFHHKSRVINSYYDVVSQLTHTFQVSDASYDRVYKNKKVISFPILVRETTEEWLDTSSIHEPLHLYDNLLELPCVSTLEEVIPFIREQEIIECEYGFFDRVRVLPNIVTYRVYNEDDSISSLTIVTKNGAFNVREYDWYFKKIIKEIEKRLFSSDTLFYELFDITEYIEPIKLNMGIEQDKFPFQLTDSENSCFYYIYHGHYDAKSLASKLSLSHRSVERIIASLIEKLGCVNKYDLVVAISKRHDYIRKLIQRSTSPYIRLR